jgi:cell pole-organizing protein PopZ
MTQAAKAAEPSMEEILASIRRIIADDEPAKPPAAPDLPPPRAVAAIVPAPEPVLPPAAEAPTPEPPPVVEDVLDLTEAMAAPAEPTVGFRHINGESDLTFEDSADQPPAAPRSPEPAMQVRRSPPPDAAALVSPTTSEAVDTAFNSLAHTVLMQNARTLEDLVRDMLRPMLKSWLDENLPSLVERLVRAEIERVSRGRG